MRLKVPYAENWNFYGNAEHGNFESNSNVTFDTSDGNQSYHFFNDFILNVGHILTTSDPCRGLYIYCLGKCVINGTINMSRRGIYSPPEGEYKNGYTPIGMNQVILDNNQITDLTISKTLTPGGTNATNASAACGGGGHSVYCTNGGISGVFSGGAGGGGWGAPTGWRGYCGPAATDYGGAGGNGRYTGSSHAAGGAGNPSGAHGDPVEVKNSAGVVIDHLDNGTGGVLFIVCNKEFIFNGNIISNGQPGKNGPYGSRHDLCGGGGSGAGHVSIIYNSLFNRNFSINTDFISLQGGLGGIRNSNSEIGLRAGNGSLRVQGLYR